MTNDFAVWLNTETEDRGWSFRELSRRSGLSGAVISDVANEKAQPGLRFCVEVARAFRLSPEDVLRKAGLLPSVPPAVAEEQEAMRILRSLSASARTTVITMLRALAREQKLPVGVVDPAVPYVTDERYVRELLEEFAQVPEEWQEMVIAQARQYRRMAETRPMHIIGDEDLERERRTETA